LAWKTCAIDKIASFSGMCQAFVCASNVGCPHGSALPSTGSGNRWASIPRRERRKREKLLPRLKNVRKKQSNSKPCYDYKHNRKHNCHCFDKYMTTAAHKDLPNKKESIAITNINTKNIAIIAFQLFILANRE
jgi:hypothetical protein